MSKAFSEKSFGVYFDPTKSTSGQRFFENLCKSLAKEAVPLEKKPAAILFNVSAPIKEIMRAKLRRQKVILRIDGLYADRLSPAFLSKFSPPLRLLLSIGLQFAWAHDSLAHLANLLDENFAAFARILMADVVVYQSQYCRDVHQRYFPKKNYRIIVNGSRYYADTVVACEEPTDDVIRLVTIYDGHMPRKRVHDLVDFVRWARTEKKVSLHLTILGYTGHIPQCVSDEIKVLIENASYIRPVPRFTFFDEEIQRILFDSDLYMTFTFRDPCPNAVVEAMAHGLPVVAVASGGIPDIVGDAGILVLDDDDREAFFSAWRHDCDFPAIDYERALSAVLEVKREEVFYRARVKARFRTDLALEIVAARYAAGIYASIGYEPGTGADNARARLD